jgi:aryl-alcohol dehydrogenase-like predicted oxidoreductase
VEIRTLGRTGLGVSALGFGCGAVGGLLVQGEPADQERAVARAIDLGITYFDTAVAYGNGRSESNLGWVLARLRANVIVGTKFTIRPEDQGRIAAAISTSLDGSLQRLGRDSVDLLQLHNAIGTPDGARTLDPATVIGEVAAALASLRQQGKIRFFGITGLGATPAVLQVIESGAFDSSQVAYNLLNPSAITAVPSGFPAQDFGGLVRRAGSAGVGTIGIRPLAAGALSGSEERHPLGMTSVDPIGSGRDYAMDVERAKRFSRLVDAGFADSLVELALRFAITGSSPSTVLVGISSLEQLEFAAACVERGPLPPEALERISRIWSELATAGE